MRFGQSRCKFAGWLSLLTVCFISAVSPALAAQTPKRVFLLEGLTPLEPSVQLAVEALKKRFKERSSEDIELYSDFLDLGRSRDVANEHRLVQFLDAKFAQLKPDIIIAMSRNAVTFASEHRREFARAIPIVYCCTPALKNDARDIPRDIPGIVLETDWGGTFALAQQLQPNAKTVVIISEAADFYESLVQDVRGALSPALQKYDTKYLAGLPYDELLKQVSGVPRDSIVLLRRVFEDASGHSRGAEFAEDVSRASAAPVYASSTMYFGSGTVGGRVGNLADQGSSVADLALEVLAGKNPSTVPHQTRLPLRTRVDARQLERWGFAQSTLPAGTSVEFQRPTLWQQYQTAVILALLVFVMLVCFIALLLIEIRKRQQAEEARRAAEAETELRRKEITHLMRVGIVSELSGGIAHELGQPLAAILANAQAAQQLVATDRHDRSEIVEILEDIVEEDRHAGEVINRLRWLLKKGEHKADLINLNEQITSTLRLVHSELLSRRIKVRTDLNAHLPLVMGDRVQMQQVFLNLMLNAMDAMVSTPVSERALSISSRSTVTGNVEVSITDRGPGMSAQDLERVFEPFFSTKEHGLGLGLPICSRIVKAHNGQLTVSNAGSGGVTAIVSLPVSIRLAAAS